MTLVLGHGDPRLRSIYLRQVVEVVHRQAHQGVGIARYGERPDEFREGIEGMVDVLTIVGDLREAEHRSVARLCNQ